MGKQIGKIDVKIYKNFIDKSEASAELVGLAPEMFKQLITTQTILRGLLNEDQHTVDKTARQFILERIEMVDGFINVMNKYNY